MIKPDCLKLFTILLVDDDVKITQKLGNALSALSATVLTASNGTEALELIKNSRVDLVLSDVSMPVMDGITLLEEVRKFDNELPFIFISAHDDSQYLLKAIQNKSVNYFLKPLDLQIILPKILQIVTLNYTNNVDMNILKEISIISKTDLAGKITYVNDAFCDVSGYSRDELIGKPHNIVRHKDTPSAAFKDLWDTIQSKEVWKGKVKNQSKDGSSYYFNTTVYPILHPKTSEILEYMSVRFLVTDEENKTRELKKNMLKTIADNKKQNFAFQAKINDLESQIEKIKYIEEKYNNEKKRATLLNTQVLHYEKEIKSLKPSYEEQIKKLKEQAVLNSNEIKDQNEKIKQLLEQIQNYQKEQQLTKKEIAKLNEQVVNQNKRMHDLKDVIKAKEMEIKTLHEQNSIE